MSQRAEGHVGNASGGRSGSRSRGRGSGKGGTFGRGRSLGPRGSGFSGGGRGVGGRGSQSSSSATPSLWHPFKAESKDHFELSAEVVRDLQPVLEQLRELMCPSSPEGFTLYDPYYCAGTVALHWQKLLGPLNVIHENRDFYEDIKQGTLPKVWDVLVTSPPFSEGHIERILDFLTDRTKNHNLRRPWAVLVPEFIPAKPWYRRWVQRHFTAAPFTPKGDITGKRKRTPSVITIPPFLASSPVAPPPSVPPKPSNSQDSCSGAAAQVDHDGPGERAEQESGAVAGVSPTTNRVDDAVLGVEPFYIIPRRAYEFHHPIGTGTAHAPSKSMWVVWTGRRTNDVLRGTRVALNSRQKTQDASVGSGGSMASRAPLEVVHGLQMLEEGGHVSPAPWKNPTRRG